VSDGASRENVAVPDNVRETDTSAERVVDVVGVRIV
jgi:hypothetical protein